MAIFFGATIGEMLDILEYASAFANYRASNIAIFT
jgi:hypothetical protein